MKDQLKKLAEEKGFKSRFTAFTPIGNTELEELMSGFWMYELQKWLREDYEVDITVALVATGYGFYIHKNRNYTNNGEHYDTLVPTYEEALEAALLYVLKNLI